MSSWTKADIEAIMVQLNKQKLPFEKYEFTALGEGMTLLGAGAFSQVYEAVSLGKKKKAYAIKVIGFGDKHVDSKAFREAVEAQTDLGLFENNIVKIYASVELLVWIEGEHEVVRVEKLTSNKAERVNGENCLHLQFVLMEKLSAVLTSSRFEQRLFPQKLKAFEEAEIIKLAYEIGMALDKAHKQKLIHRDIKLENIFYSVNSGHYKLGDFGIAKTTDDGMASTVAFTKGYGAPEVVGTLEDKYDCTADIYSFGMLLYVLLNEMRFPEAMDYHPTVFQYMRGYIPPAPINGSDELVEIVLKMLSFDPDDRYQSMEEVLNEFDRIKYGKKVKYQREHKNVALALGTVFGVMGVVGWKLSDSYAEYRWMAVLLISLGVVLLLLHSLLGERDDKLIKTYFGKNLFWIIMTLSYFELMILEFIIKISKELPMDFYEKLFNNKIIEWILSWNPTLVGAFGTCFCIIWWIREQFLIWIERKPRV